MINRFVDYMPLICVAGSAAPNPNLDFYTKESLLQHFSHCVLHEIVTNTPSTAKFEQQISDSLIHGCVYPDQHNLKTSDSALDEYQQWALWREKLTQHQTDASFDLGFQLQEAGKETDFWQLHFLAISKQDPSLKLFLSDYWLCSETKKKELQKYFGKDFENHLLLNLGYAARMYPKLWQGLETEQPRILNITLTEAFEFLTENAWILEDAGYKVMIPAWWTPEGRRRAKIRLKASARSASKTAAKKGYFSIDTLVQYEYELSIGGQPVSPQEWQQLVNAKTPCKYIAGVYYVVASHLDNNPFLLFELRGLPQAELQTELAKSSLGKALSTQLAAKEISLKSANSYFPAVKKATVNQAMNPREFWLGTKRLPQMIEEVSAASFPAILIKKQGDYPAFWHKDNSFIATMEELYERVRTKNKDVF